MKRLSRYGVIDAYTLEELCRKYKISDGKRRIALLKQFWHRRNDSRRSTPDMPFDIAVMAVEDSNLEVRQWVAQNAQYLNFKPPTESPDTDGWPYETDGWPKASERDLTKRLRHDSDPFVRACLHENSSVVGYQWVTVFHSATHLERLALMRNEEAAAASNRPEIREVKLLRFSDRSSPQPLKEKVA